MRFTNNGYTVTLHTDLEMAVVRDKAWVMEEYDQVTIAGSRYWYKKDTDWYKFALKSGYFDYAMPQSFWDEYMAKHGRPPHGVWCYEKELGFNLFGGFLSYQQAFVIATDKILQMMEGKDETSNQPG